MIDESEHYESNSFNCMDCGEDTLQMGEYYMLKEKVWREVVPKDGPQGMLCIGCFEIRLGKKHGEGAQLTFGAFTHCPLNCAPGIQRSHRLFQRLTAN